MRKTLVLAMTVLTVLVGGNSFAEALSGTGSEADPYLIQSLSDFEEFRTNSAYHAAGTFTTLTTDLDLAGNSYLGPVVTGYYYYGTFDGNGKTISNITSAGGSSGTALFYYVCGVVKNLNLTHVNFSGTHAGGICVSVQDVTDAVENCYVQGQITGSGTCGGITAGNGGTISNCFADCTVTGGAHSGGLVASNDGGTIENCYASGTVVAGGTNYYGGLVGYNLNSGIIRKCYSDAFVQNAQTNTYQAALVGRQTGIVQDCFWNEDVNPGLTGCQPSDTAATGLSAAEMQVESNFTDAGWDFAGETVNGTDDIWMMPDPGAGPVLRWVREGTYCLHPPVGDISGDCLVNLTDLALMASNWLRCGYSNQDLCP